MFQRLRKWLLKLTLAKALADIEKELEQVEENLKKRDRKLAEEERNIIRLSQEDVKNAWERVGKLRDKVAVLEKTVETYKYENQSLREQIDILEKMTVPAVIKAHQSILDVYDADSRVQAKRGQDPWTNEQPGV